MTVSFGRFSLKNPISTGRNRMECVPSASAGKSFSPKRQRILEKLSGAPCQFRQERDRRHFVYASGTLRKSHGGPLELWPLRNKA
ncbi:hypothetical protein ACVWXM_009772 [Bradyrhizobium sp. GM7.3]